MRSVVPGAAVVTVEAVLNAGSSVAVAATSVQIVERENLAFPVVADVRQIMRASIAPLKSAGRMRVVWALNPPLVSAYWRTPFWIFVPVTQAATAGVAVGRSQNEPAVALLQPAVGSHTLNGRVMTFPVPSASSVLFVKTSGVALPTAVSVAAGIDQVTLPRAPVTGRIEIVPEVAFLRSIPPTDEPATPNIPTETPSVVNPATVFDPCPPPEPMTTERSVSAAADVTQVAQVIVPDDVIVPPPIGDVVAMDVTVPDPAPEMLNVPLTRIFALDPEVVASSTRRPTIQPVGADDCAWQRPFVVEDSMMYQPDAPLPLEASITQAP